MDREASQLAQHFQKLTPKRKADYGVILWNQEEISGNGCVDVTLNLVKMKRTTLSAIHMYFDAVD
jgi:hypothetical protein